MILFHLFETTSFVKGQNVVDSHLFLLNFPVKLQLIVVIDDDCKDDVAHH